jgi:hypothetical protein
MQDQSRDLLFSPRPDRPLPRPPHLPHLPSGGGNSSGYRNGTLLRGDDDDYYLVENGTRCKIPDTQTLYLSGHTPGSATVVAAAQLAAIPAGPPVPAYPYVVATGEYRSGGGGHIATCHASINLQTGLITGTTTTTNYVQFAGYHSGTLLVPRNEAGDPVLPRLPGVQRFGVGGRWFGDPVTRTDSVGYQLDPEAAKRVCHFDVIVTDSADDLQQTLSKIGLIGTTAKQWSWLFSEVASFATHGTGTGSKTP